MSLNVIAIIPNSPLIIWISSCSSPMNLSRLETFERLQRKFDSDCKEFFAGPHTCSSIINRSVLVHFAAWISHLDISGWIFDLSNMFSLLFKIIKVMGWEN